MIDTHFHLMQSNPSDDGNGLDDYIEAMDAFGITSGFVVQPSAHRFNTKTTLSAVARNPDRFKAVAVVPPEIGTPELAALRKRGVVGIRLNMISNPEQTVSPPPDFLKRVRDAGMFLQVFSSGDPLARLVEETVESRLRLVVDHLGKPDPGQTPDQLGFREMLDGAKEGWVYIKLSGPFRLQDSHVNYQSATDFARFALKNVPLTQFIAGTDWPFIHLDRKPTMDSVLGWLRELLPNDSDWNTVGTENARRLCRQA